MKKWLTRFWLMVSLPGVLNLILCLDQMKSHGIGNVLLSALLSVVLV